MTDTEQQAFDSLKATLFQLLTGSGPIKIPEVQEMILQAFRSRSLHPDLRVEGNDVVCKAFKFSLTDVKGSLRIECIPYH